MPRPRPRDLRQRVLQNLGIVPVRARERTSKKLIKAVTPQEVGKTWAMMALEQRHNKSIEEILTSGSLRKIHRRYGISHTTVWRWKERLGLNGSPESEAAPGLATPTD